MITVKDVRGLQYKQFFELSPGDTFVHVHDVYIKIANVYSKENDKEFNAVCVENGRLVSFDLIELVDVVDIEAVIS